MSRSEERKWALIIMVLLSVAMFFAYTTRNDVQHRQQPYAYAKAKFAR